MLKLRKILLCNYLFYIAFIFSISLTIIRINIPKLSNYNENSKVFTGIIIQIIEKEDKIIYKIKNKEIVIGTLYLKNKEKIEVHLGDKVKIIGTFQKPQKNTTKNLFNYQKYCKRNNIFYVINIYSLKVIKKNHNIYYFIKQKVINYLNKDPYLNTFLLGEKSYLKEEVKRSYQENGISHLFAISGMHITLLATIIEKLSKKYLNEENIFKVTSIFLLGYLIIVGLSPSILRGVLFYILFSINRIYYLYISPKNLFLLVLSISILINPNNIWDTGFLYSYSISYALIIKSKDLSNKSYFHSLLKISIFSLIVSLPITLYTFYQINLLSIIYNLVFVPIISIIIFPFSLLTIIIKPLLPIYHFMIKALESISLVLEKIKIGKLILKKIPTIFYYIYTILILMWLNRKKRKYLYILLILLIIHYIYPYIIVNNYIHITDVGQGDSALLHINKKIILIDTGGEEKSKLSFNTLIPFFKAEGISKINWLILTHGDFDHMGEAINLVENFKVGKVIFNCGEYNELEQELIKVLNKKKIKYYSCIKELNVDDNKLYFLQTKEYDNENDNSNVIYTEINGYKFMFMGDASVTTEKEILSKYNLPDIDVLKVGHHGSRTSSGEEFIDEINPKYSVISVGKNNRYGHPNKEVLENLKESKIYRTDQDGSIMFKIKNNKLQIETCSS